MPGNVWSLEISLGIPSFPLYEKKGVRIDVVLDGTRFEENGKISREGHVKKRNRLFLYIFLISSRTPATTID